MNDNEVGKALKNMVIHGRSNDAMPGAAGTGVDGDGDGDCIWRRAPNPVHSNLSSDEEQFGTGSRIGLASTHRRGMGRRLNQSGQRSQPDSGRGTPAGHSNSTSGAHSSSHHTHSHSLSNPSSHSVPPKPAFQRSVSIQAHSHMMNGVNRNFDAQNSHHLPSPSPSPHTAGFPPPASNPMTRSASHYLPSSSSTSSSASGSNARPHTDSSKSSESHAASSKSKAPKSPSPHEGGSICPAYNNLLGYSTSFLANLLSPKSALCHQKFELIVDELVFVGHPVCVDADGGWGFEETYKSHNEDKGKGASMGSAELGGEVAVTPDDTPDVSPNPSSTAATVYPTPTPNTGGAVTRGRQIGREGSSATIAAPPKPLPLYPEPKSGSAADTTDLELEANAGDDEHDDSPSLSVSRARTRSITSHSHGHNSSISTKTPPFSPRNSDRHAGQGHSQGVGGKAAPSRKESSQLTSFHLVFVLDRPDSTSATSSDLPKFIDIFYR